jgi:hypothetical protein
MSAMDIGENTHASNDPGAAGSCQRGARHNANLVGCRGNRDVGQLGAIRRGAQFVTTQTDVGFLAAAAGQWTAGMRAGLKQS